MIRKLTELEMSNFARATGEWLRGRGEQSNIVISTRIRLARNIRGYPFPTRMNDAQRREVVELVARSFRGNERSFDLDASNQVDRALLVERHLISKELAGGEGARGVIFGRHEMISVMVNEEDHLRIQCIKSGFELDRAWRALRKIDGMLERQLPYAFSDRYGFLTSCPTNIGTGIRVSVMLHLPALSLKRDIARVHKAVNQMNCALRGLYGENTEAFGDFYQVSNQITLGKSEEELIAMLRELAPIIIRYEQLRRDELLGKERAMIEDRVERALGTLRAARQINVEEMMSHMSMVRLGIAVGLIVPGDVDIGVLNELFLLCQPAHLQKSERRNLLPEERDVTRARIIRARLAPASLN